QQLRGGEPGVAVAEGGLRVRIGGSLVAATGVGDRVSLEEERDARLQRRAAGSLGGARMTAERMCGSKRRGANGGELTARNGGDGKIRLVGRHRCDPWWRGENLLPIA